MKFFDKRRRELSRAIFWLTMADAASGIIDNLNGVNPNTHPFWTPTDLRKEKDKYIEILTYSLMRYKHAIMRAE